MSHSPVVVLAAGDDHRRALSDALADFDTHAAPDSSAVLTAVDGERVGAVVCHAGDVAWARIADGAATHTPAVPVFVLTDGAPAPDAVAATGAKPVYAADDWDWATALAAQVSDAARDYRVRVEHDHTREHYDQLVENAPVPIALIGPDRVVRRTNPAAARLLGYDDADAIEGRPIGDFVDDDALERANDRIERVIEGRVAVPPVGMTLRDADDQAVRVLAATSPALLDGDPAAQAILPPDESYQTRRELAENREKIEAIHRVAVELEGAETTAEVCERTIAAAEEILEFDICVIDSVRDDRFVVEASSEQLPEENVTHSPSDSGVLGAAYQSGETVITEDVSNAPEADPQGPYESALSIPLGDWGAFQAASTERGAFDEDDAELAEILLAHAHMAVERIERREDLRERERVFSTLHDATREMAHAETQQAVLERAIEAAKETLGFRIAGAFEHDPDARCLRPVTVTAESRDLIGDPPTLKAGETLAYDVYESGEPMVYDDISGIDGVENPETAIRSEMILPLGEYGVIVFGDPEANAFDDVDVTAVQVLAANTTTVLERVAREADLKQERERLDEFASIVAHDLRNPLNHASGFLELADETGDGEYFERVEENLDQMDALISDVLSLARQGDVIGDTEAVDLRNAAETAWRNVTDDDDALVLPENAERVVADRDRLLELLGNLFENARTHGGEDATVEVGALDDGFYVADDGPGIPESDRDRVFDRGYSTSDTGTGFGLSIVSSIANAHGWDVRVTESDRGGARFEFRDVTTPASRTEA